MLAKKQNNLKGTNSHSFVNRERERESNSTSSFLTSLPLFLISIICFSTIAFAGNLTPPAGSPAPTMFSLEQIYNSIAGSSYDSSGFSADVDGNVHEQLKYIASIISAGYTYGDEDPDYVLTTADGAGNAYGSTNPELVAGTAEAAGSLLKDMFNGTGTTENGGSQENGGEEDCAPSGSDICQSPPSDRYATSWTFCDSDNSYCDTGDNAAKAQDNATGLVWSYPCSGTNCSNLTNETADTYNWYYQARTVCSSGAHGKSGWSLPHQKQLMQAYINGAYGNLEDTGGNIYGTRLYWTATYSTNFASTFAWAVNLARGLTSIYNAETANNYVRCIRPTS